METEEVIRCMRCGDKILFDRWFEVGGKKFCIGCIKKASAAYDRYILTLEER